MQQIADWLEKLGMSEYAQRFAENDISFSILSDLTDQDLKEIGVSSAPAGAAARAIWVSLMTPQRNAAEV
jgi:SAM domain (Sterile alpha motif)